MRTYISHLNRWWVGLFFSTLLLGTLLLPSLTQVAFAAPTAEFLDANTIRCTGCGDPDPHNLIKQANGNYLFSITISGGRAGSTTVAQTISGITKVNGGGYTANIATAANGNPVGVNGTVSIADPKGAGPGGGNAGPGGAGATGGGVAAPTTCEDVGGALSWAFCGILEQIDNAINGVIDGIEGLLSVDRLYGNTSGGLYKVWGAVRNIALLILVPMMLLMVIGTAIDMGPFDAYTVKKALPRMLFAVMFILLSWSICTFFIDMSDALGAGLINFITTVGSSGQVDPDSITFGFLLNKAIGGSGALQGSLFTGLIVGGTGAAAIGVASIGIIGSLALSALLGLLLGYLVLIFRQLLILGLLVFAPIAILVWIFPGNDKIWTFWKTSFIGLLAVFPVVAALIGLGRVAAFIVAGL